jgi:glucose-1-phosphate cytidylyltransferase|tara:strand:+ start:133 stop:279 length:147 start_codon:yes stop_codon:yes gene_type:complete
MKTIILAGGWDTRLGQMTEVIPKQVVPIGGKPVLWYIISKQIQFLTKI